jgi:hypothetical protein
MRRIVLGFASHSFVWAHRVGGARVSRWWNARVLSPLCAAVDFPQGVSGS